MNFQLGYNINPILSCLFFFCLVFSFSIAPELNFAIDRYTFYKRSICIVSFITFSFYSFCVLGWYVLLSIGLLCHIIYIRLFTKVKNISITFNIGELIVLFYLFFNLYISDIFYNMFDTDFVGTIGLGLICIHVAKNFFILFLD